MTASAVPSTAIPKRKVTAAPKMDPIAAMSPSPHQDDRLLKIPIKNDRIFGYNELCTKSGLGAVAEVYDRRLCRKLLDCRRSAKRKRDSAQP